MSHTAGSIFLERPERLVPRSTQIMSCHKVRTSSFPLRNIRSNISQHSSVTPAPSIQRSRAETNRQIVPSHIVEAHGRHKEHDRATIYHRRHLCRFLVASSAVLEDEHWLLGKIFAHRVLKAPYQVVKQLNTNSLPT